MNFDFDIDYALAGNCFSKLRQIAVQLDDPRSLSFDQRRDMANLINLILSKATPLDGGYPGEHQ